MSKVDQLINVNEISRVSVGTSIKGEIISSSDIRIDGNFEGKIVSKGKVVIGDKAVVKGDMICSNADIWGKMEGGVLYVRDTLSLKESCVFKGQVGTKRFHVDLGAEFDGNCKMLEESEFDQIMSSHLNSNNASTNAADKKEATK